MNTCGVYTILNLVTGRRYVGSSVNVPQRWNQHLSMLTRGIHINAQLQADWTRYGAPSFSWVLTEACDTRRAAIAAEQTHIDASPELYNAARRAGSGPCEGFQHTAEMNRRQSDATKGRPKPVGFGAKISAMKKGVPNPKHGDAIRGRKHSPEHCEKISKGNTGKTHTAEHKAYMRDMMTGRSVTWGDKISAGKLGKPWSATRRAAFNARTHAITQ